MSEGWTSSKATPEEMKTFLAAEKEAHKTKLDRMFCTHEWPSVRLDGAPCDLKKSFFELLDLATEKGWIQKQNNILEAVRAGLNFSISDIVDDKSFFDQQPQEIPSNEEVKKIIEEMDKLERFGIFENFINDPRFESAMNGKQFFSMEELVSLYKFNIMLSNIMVSARVQIVEGFKKDGFAVQIDCEKTLELYTYSIIDKIVRSFKGQYAEGANLLIIIFRSKIPFQIATLGWNTIRGDDVFVMDKLYDLLP
ncbi:hypothetical protein SDC9_97999 [bioreactor metagenome]|uniref:Uncharacterized protein n=1 Tax=bioreactor metagenome TaxID=1076179 RepID=A0A645AG40_9ZZZZ